MIKNLTHVHIIIPLHISLIFSYSHRDISTTICSMLFKVGTIVRQIWRHHRKSGHLSEFCRILSNFVRNLSDFFRNLSEFCSNVVRILSDFFRILSEFCLNFVRMLSEFCPNCPKHKDPRPYKMLSTLSSQYVARKINIKQGTPIDVF